MALMLHAGGFKVEASELKDVPTPEATKTWTPIPHYWYADSIRTCLQEAGCEIEKEEHGLAKDGNRYFGMMYLKRDPNWQLDSSRDPPDATDYQILVGLRNSHDMSYPAGFSCGAHVFICDNLSFSGEVVMKRRHTVYIKQDLPRLVFDAVSKLGSMRHTQEQRFQRYRNFIISEGAERQDTQNREVDHLIMEAMKARVIAPSNTGLVWKEWDTPTLKAFQNEPRNLWRLFNAFTTVLTPRIATDDIVKRTITLHGMLDAYSGLVLQQAS